MTKSPDEHQLSKEQLRRINEIQLIIDAGNNMIRKYKDMQNKIRLEKK
jgi:hypothetical protein